MKCRMDSLSVPFKSTPVDNLFLETYLSVASGTAIKVYLYCLKLATYPSNESVDLERIARDLNITVQETERALNYWETQNILYRVEEDGETEYRFKDLRLMYLGVDQREHIKPEHKDIEDENFAKSYREPKILEDLAFKNMIDRLEEFIRVNRQVPVDEIFNEREVREILDFMEKYHLDSEFYYYAYCKIAEEEGPDFSPSPQHINGYLGRLIRYDGTVDRTSLDAYYQRKKEEKAEKKEKKKSRSSGRKKKEDAVSKEERQARLKEYLEKQRDLSQRMKKDG